METHIVQQPSATFWAGKRVVVTGHSGFKGSWLTLWLCHLGAEVTGISLAPNTSPNLFTAARVSDFCVNKFLDIRDADRLVSAVETARPEIVFHLAAQPLVRASYRDPVETFSTNVQGTVNFLQALRGCDQLRVAVIVTTDKVYRNREWLWPYRESDVIGGRDPYSASKAASELIIDSYRDSFLAKQCVSVSSARAGNVIGGGDWSEDRLLPDAIRAWGAGGEISIRHPDATRPWQYVLEPILGYLKLAHALWIEPSLSGAYNFGPESSEGSASVRDVIELARKVFGEGGVRYEPVSVGPPEAGRLALDVNKAKTVLGVRSLLTLEQSVFETMRWYKSFYSGKSARELCLDGLSRFEALI